MADPDLRARLTPSYSFGCKRVLPSNEWYPAITQPNVDVVTEGIAEVAPNGIVSRDGVLHEVDTIVFATGFHVTDAPFARIIRGRDRGAHGGHVERQPAGLQGHRRGRVSQPLHHDRARTPGSGTTRSSS